MKFEKFVLEMQDKSQKMELQFQEKLESLEKQFVLSFAVSSSDIVVESLSESLVTGTDSEVPQQTDDSLVAEVKEDKKNTKKNKYNTMNL